MLIDLPNASIDDAIGSLVAAYSQDGGDFGFYTDAGALTRHQLSSSNAACRPKRQNQLLRCATPRLLPTGRCFNGVCSQLVVADSGAAGRPRRTHIRLDRHRNDCLGRSELVRAHNLFE